MKYILGIRYNVVYNYPCPILLETIFEYMNSKNFSYFDQQGFNNTDVNSIENIQIQQYYNHFQMNTTPQILIIIKTLIEIIQAKLSFVTSNFQYQFNKYTYKQLRRFNKTTTTDIINSIIKHYKNDNSNRKELIKLFKTYKTLEDIFNYYNQELFNQNSKFAYSPHFYLFGGNKLLQYIDTYKPLFQELDSLLEQCLNSFNSIN